MENKVKYVYGIVTEKNANYDDNDYYVDNDHYTLNKTSLFRDYVDPKNNVQVSDYDNKIIDTSTEDVDTVYSFINYKLSSGLRNLTLSTSFKDPVKDISTSGNIVTVYGHPAHYIFLISLKKIGANNPDIINIVVEP